MGTLLKTPALVYPTLQQEDRSGAKNFFFSTPPQLF